MMFGDSENDTIMNDPAIFQLPDNSGQIPTREAPGGTDGRNLAVTFGGLQCYQIKNGERDTGIPF